MHKDVDSGFEEVAGATGDEAPNGPDGRLSDWQRACRMLEQAGYGHAVTNTYRSHGKLIADIVGYDAAAALAETVSSAAIKAGTAAAARLPEAALTAARRSGDTQNYHSWVNTVHRLCAHAPESLAAVLERTDELLRQLDAAQFDAWVLAGLRSAGSDASRRQRFFTLEDEEASRWLHREAGDVTFNDVDRRLKAYLTALWHLRAPTRESSRADRSLMQHRSSFSGGVIRVPASFPSYRGQEAQDIFRACMAHIGAHFMFSSERFPVGELRPVQVALVSLIEDARVEHLAMRQFPGLRELWSPFHTAGASGALTAPSLFARLARALFDPDLEQDNGWVQKGRNMFLEHQSEWHSPEISRRIGGLLGNDLGQMRVQFNSKTYQPDPPYRDDNNGLWNFEDGQQPEEQVEETISESVQMSNREDDDHPDREQLDDDVRSDTPVNRARPREPEEGNEGIPVARYGEYDYVIGRERPGWTTIVEYQPEPGRAGNISAILERNAETVNRLSAIVKSACVSRPERIKRQHEGETLDIDACIGSVIDRRRGDTPDPRVYLRTARRQRDLSVLVLLDISQSTADRVLGTTSTVLDLECQAIAMLAEAMAGMGDPFAIAAFCSDKRDDVHYVRIKDFNAPYDGAAKASLAGLKSGLSTRMGAAMRHAATDLGSCMTHRRLLLVITDGEPSDIDIADPRYLVDDARAAAQRISQEGTDVFCVGLGSGVSSNLDRIFGRRNVVQIDRVERLPERLPQLYLRLTT